VSRPFAGIPIAHALGVPVQIDVTDKDVFLRAEERGQLAVGLYGGEHRDLVVESTAHHAIALPVLRQTEVAATFDQQQAAEVQQRVGQQGFAAEHLEVVDHPGEFLHAGCTFLHGGVAEPLHLCKQNETGATSPLLGGGRFVRDS